MKEFPKIFHLGESYIEHIFNGIVEITEKIDGSQFSFGINEMGDEVFRSKNTIIYSENVQKLFAEAIEQAKRIIKLIDTKDTQVYCEYLQKPKHNILQYGRIPRNHFYLFGYRVGNNFFKNEDLISIAEKFDIEPPNILYVGKTDISNIEKFLNNYSILGNEKIEGIVVKNYEESTIVGGMIIPICTGKYVRTEFREKNKINQDNIRKKENIEYICNKYKSETRWYKAFQHLRDEGKITFSNRDIGNLINETINDLIEEEKENIKEDLYNLFINKIKKYSIKNLPEWWKRGLLENKFK